MPLNETLVYYSINVPSGKGEAKVVSEHQAAEVSREIDFGALRVQYRLHEPVVDTQGNLHEYITRVYYSNPPLEDKVNYD